ncbi:MAG: hypothetical protein EXR72_22980 [Myxococcales bacterium]|nr:hypothetical protein [Myxococcales bacterium]
MMRSPLASASAIGLAVLLVGCGASGPPGVGDPPSAPTANDPRFVVQSRTWLMAGDGLTPGDRYEVTVTAPPGTGYVDAWIDRSRGVRLQSQGDGTFRASIPSAATGDHVALLAADGAGVGFASRTFHVSHALYVVVSADWDNSDNSDLYLANIDDLHVRHPRLVVSHFFGPWVLTDPKTSQARKDVNTKWIKRQRDQFGDEIGLHIHPWCNFVTTVTLGGKPLACRNAPAFASDTDDSGYTVVLASYTVDEQAALFSGAAQLMEKNGLGRPISFRAGGWTTDGGTMTALTRAGYTVESSAFPPDTIQKSWAGTLLASWNATHWDRITRTSQPYYPSTSDIQSPDPPPTVPVLEVPDNGSLVDYMTGPQMLEVLAANWTAGTSLAEPRVYQIGFHPPNFSKVLANRISVALAEADKGLYADDRGPLVMAPIGALTRVWPRSGP